MERCFAKRSILDVWQGSEYAYDQLLFTVNEKDTRLASLKDGEKPIIFRSIIFVETILCQKLTHFLLMFSFYTFSKRQKTSSFLDFSEGMEVENWHEIGYVSTSNDCLQSVWFRKDYQS